ncbi:tRNA-dependent lipid II--amino acid ligase [Aquipluma nitroreducens]|uniref:tRNA-dependent lipid II--amino acid ligase n=1 Tax=Aquipluma nitroreducens TaxID=2010828 RepID=A0A5K7S428_9BACT|nr:GNAT family N-acetyltransferase [Aquipluma nitroreducens]BBE16230.1 tRNA-dependent lipid II--amino acid ligase [Aquipluma nitroreducens]
MNLITEPENIEKKKWSDFVMNHPNGNIFQTPAIFDLYDKTPKYETVFCAALDSRNEIVGLNLAIIQKEHFGIFGQLSARSIIWGGPLIKEENPEVLDLLLRKYKEQIHDKAIYTQFRNLWQWSASERSVFENNSYEYIDHLDILIDLKIDENKLFNNFHSGRRKNIRRAERIPLVFEQVVDASEIKQCELLVKETYKRVKLPCPDKSFFDNAKTNLCENGMSKIFAVKYQDQIISCRYELCYKDLIYDWYAGTSETHLDKYPNDYLPWKILQWAKENKYSTFDFGGAGKPNEPYGVREYKLKFGGELVNYGRFEAIHKPRLMKLGKLGFIIYKKINGLR